MAGKVQINDTDKNVTILLDGDTGTATVGGETENGAIIIQDNQNSERIHLNAGDGDMRIKNAAGDTLFLLNSSNAGLYVGGKGNEGDLVLRDGAVNERIHLSAGDGDMRVRDSAGETLFLFDSQYAALYIGGAGNEGDVIVRNDDGNETIRLNGGNGDIILTNADCAEEFDFSDASLATPGSVMVIDDEECLTLATEAYDRRVAGVVSGAGAYRPGIVLDRRKDDTPRPAVALMGKVYCKVDASHGPIRVGDLLVSSPTPGHAMVAQDPARWPGAVLGKALRAWTDDRGMIPCLVSLQ